MTPEQQAREIMSAIVAATIGRTDVADIAERVIAAALAERDLEIQEVRHELADTQVNELACLTRRDALVAAVENWRKAAIRILDGETEAASEFEDAGIVLDAALAAGRGEK